MVQSLDRGLEILSILERKNGASITELAEELQVNKSTASRLVETLKQHDMVQFDSAVKSTGWASASCISARESSAGST